MYLRPAQPVSVLIPHGEMSSVVTNYETRDTHCTLLQVQQEGDLARISPSNRPSAIGTRAKNKNTWYASTHTRRFAEKNKNKKRPSRTGCLTISFHICQILCPSKTGFVVSAHRLPNITLLTLIATLQLQGESPTYILNEDAQPVIRAIGVSHTACKDEFRQNLRSHSWSVF